MPRNFKEAMVFTLMMCAMMVFGMSVWNLILVGHFSWANLLRGYPLGFVVAFLLDVLVIGLLAKKAAFKVLPKLPNHDGRWVKITLISGFMVLGMVTCMSLFGLLVNRVSLGLTSYGRAWVSNLVMALPLNFILVGPIARYLLGHVQKPLTGEVTVEDFEDDEELPTII